MGPQGGAAGDWGSDLIVNCRSALHILNTLQSHPAVVLFVYLYAKSTIPDARARNLRNPNRFFKKTLRAPD
jgi:hypothetical protein